MQQTTMAQAPNLYSGDTSPTSPYNAGQSALDRLRSLSEQRASYNAVMMRKAEDRYNQYMSEMQRRYDMANRSRPWWKKAISGLTGGAIMGGMTGLMTGGPVGAIAGMGIGAVGGATMGGLGAGGESGVDGMFPMVAQGAMMGAMRSSPYMQPTQYRNVAGPMSSANVTGLGMRGGGYNMPNYLSPAQEFQWPR